MNVFIVFVQHLNAVNGVVMTRWIDSMWCMGYRATDRAKEVNASMKACGADSFRAVVVEGLEVGDAAITESKSKTWAASDHPPALALDRKP